MFRLPTDATAVPCRSVRDSRRKTVATNRVLRYILPESFLILDNPVQER